MSQTAAARVEPIERDPIAVADGLMRHGRQGARAALNRFWHDVSQAARFSPLKRAPLDMFMGNWNLDSSPAYVFFDVLTRMASPYELNPWDANPLRDTIRAYVDFERLHHRQAVKLFVSATNVRRGRIKIFELDEISLDAVRRVRPPSDLRPCEPPRRYGTLVDDGQAWTDLPQCRGLRARPECDSRR